MNQFKRFSVVPWGETQVPDNCRAGRPPYNPNDAVRAAAYLVLLALLTAFSSLAAQTKDPAELLRQGLFEEEANRDFAKAAAAYSGVVEQYDSQRNFAATALFRLAEIRVKQGKKENGAVLYQRLLAEFPNHDPLARLSRERLAALGAPAPALAAAAGSAPSDAAPPREAAELVRLRGLVQNSPDLLNAIGNGGEMAVGFTPLMNAADEGWLQAAAFLLDHGAEINGPDKGGQPLHLAARNGHKSMVDLLLAKGADINAATPDGWTALHAACYYRRTEIIRLLLEKGAKPDRLFHLRTENNASTPGWGQDRNSIILGGQDRNSIILGEATATYCTPLFIALEQSDDELFARLLDHGADPNFGADPRTDSIHCSPLIYTLGRGQEEASKLLLARGAKPDAVDGRGRTALHAAATGSPALVSLLLDRGVPQTADEEGRTPLFAGIITGLQWSWADQKPEYARVSGKRFPVYRASWEAMLKHGADLNARDKEQERTVLFYCLDNVETPPEALGWLLDHGADLNARDKTKKTPLHRFCFQRRGRTLDKENRARLAWLLAHGADIDARDFQNETPLDLGAFQDHFGLRREFYLPQVIPRLTGGRKLTILTNLKATNEGRTTPLRLAAANEVDAPPALAALMQAALTNTAPERVTVSVYRAAGAGKAAEAARLTLTLTLKAGPVEAAKWPALSWGDVVVFDAEEGEKYPGNEAIKWYEATLASLKRTVTVQIGDRTETLTLAAPLPKLLGGAEMRVVPPRFIQQVPRLPDGVQLSGGWAPAMTPLPAWPLPTLVERLTAAEPRAQLAAVRVERAGIDGGKMQSWTVDLRGAPEAPEADEADGNDAAPPAPAQPSSAQLADGDRLIIPLLPADDKTALAARRETISFAAPGRLFVEPLLTRRQNPTGGHTLGDLLVLAYLRPMIVPYPDLARVVIHRLKGDGGEEEHLSVDVAAMVRAFSGSNGATEAHILPALQWGDVVEVAVIAGADPTQWNGLSQNVRAYLQGELIRSVTVSVDGVIRSDSALQPAFYDFGFGLAGAGRDVPEFHSSDAAQAKPFTLSALLGAERNGPNVVRIVLSAGDQKRAYSAAQLKTDDPWINPGEAVDIQQMSP